MGKNDSNPNGRRSVTPDDIQDRGFTEHLRLFYKKVISCFREAESVLIFGPGEPKWEIAKLAQKSDIPGHIAGIETVGKMTDRQIAAKTRSFFHDRDRRGGAKKATGHSKPDFRKSRRRADFVRVLPICAGDLTKAHK